MLGELDLELENGNLVDEFFSTQLKHPRTCLHEGRQYADHEQRRPHCKGMEWFNRAAFIHLHGHTGPVRAIALSPDDQTLASASNDGVRL